ncbi:MAG: response regulator, partial [Bacteroidetes bacterium]
MTQPCRILLVEDSPEDYEIIRYNLKKGGLDADIVRVETESEYVERLAAGGVDVVLSDANLPRFSGREALEVRNRLAPLVPFILVSGAVGDEMAVEFLRNGCVDYVLKEKLTRLPSAVTRAV